MRGEVSNSFTGGFFADFDVQRQPENSYHYASNIRVFFNADGSASLENDKGNTLSFTLEDFNGNALTDYIPIGKAVFSDKVVIFSTDNTNSEIGFVTVNADGIGTYTQVFNDNYDPNGDLLGFSVLKNIEAHPVKENEDTENVYWTDNNKEFSAINIQRGSSFSWSPTLGVYPYWYSVHSLRVYCDFVMGRIKYKERIEGKLKTGVYQYSYRMGTYDGYRTPWYPITRHFVMNSQDYISDVPYQMQPSNDVTVYGNRLEISDLDVRFPIIEVAYIYSISETQTVDAGIFYYDERGAKGVTTITVDHITHAGDPVSLDEFNIKYFPLRRVKTLEEKDNYLLLGNVTEAGVLEPDVSGTTISPITRLMPVDQTDTDEDDAPFMIPEVVDTTVNITSYTGTTESYDIKNEFENYKGTAFENLFTSYWRGETYRIGCLLYDRKGMPNYTFFIDDVTFQEQYDASGNFTLTATDAGQWKIRILGFEVNNLVIPADVLYDSNGELNISGFAIVRAKRVPQTQFQGIVMPTVYENSDESTNGIAYWKNTRPLPMTENYFLGNVNPVTGSYANNALKLIGTKSRDDKFFGQRTGTVLMHSPEILFGYTPTPEWTENTNIKSVGVAATTGQQQNQPGYNLIDCPACHYYSKNYDTNSVSPSGFNFGEISYLDKAGIFKTGLGDDYQILDYDNQNPNLIFTQYGVVGFQYSGNDCEHCPIEKYSWGQPDSLLLLLKDLKDVSAGTDAERNKVLIANFRKPIDSYFSGADENALEKTIYISTGHFQPINATVITDTEQADGSLLFNNIEVWGGDCYPFFFDFTRLLPQYRECEKVILTDCYKDYSVSMIAPLESNINFSLRIGRQFAYSSIEPEMTACGETPYKPRGIQEKQREDFNINSVLQHEENVQFFSAKPTDIVNRTENPMTIIHSNLKYYGEPIDNYRRYLVNNFIDLTGVNGDITSLFSQYSYIYFLQEVGFGRLYINQPATLSSPEQGNIIVGSAGVLTGALYLSQDIGCQHQFSVTTGHNQTYWVDVNLGKMYRFDQNGIQPISDQKGQHNRIFTACKYYKGKDNPASRGGIHGTYDYKNNEFVCTFRMGIKTGLPDDASLYEFTLVYSENTQVFTTLLSETPKFYFPFVGLYFLDDDANQQNIYAALKGNRGEYFGVLKDGEFEIIVNADLGIQKIFDTNVINVNEDGVDILSQAEYTTDINSVTLSLLTDPRVKYRHGFEYLPIRGISQVDRIRGKYMSASFTIVNSANKVCRITNILTKLRPVFPR